MVRAVLFAAFLGGVLLVAATSRSDVATPASTTTPTLPAGIASEEPISGTPAVPSPGDETPARDPFSPYDIGPAGTKSWSYSDLSATERAEVAAAHDATPWPQVNNVFAAAAAERAHQASGDAAAHGLGLDNLATTGVVP